MARWRESRMQELQASATGTGRKASPRRRVWGRVDDVDAGGYLDAIEKVAPGTVVVVCIYDPEVCMVYSSSPFSLPFYRKGCC